MSDHAVTSKWMQDGKFRARCLDCDFRLATQRSPQATVKRHVEQTGHAVQVERGQWKLVEPESRWRARASA